MACKNCGGETQSDFCSAGCAGDFWQAQAGKNTKQANEGDAKAEELIPAFGKITAIAKELLDKYIANPTLADLFILEIAIRRGYLLCSEDLLKISAEGTQKHA